MFKVTIIALVAVLCVGCLPEDTEEIPETDTSVFTEVPTVETQREPLQIYCHNNPRKCPKPRI